MEQKQADLASNTDFRKITEAAERISSIIGFTKEYEEIGINDPVWQDLPAVIALAAEEFRPGTLRLENNIPPGTGIFADPLIVKVFYNLMDNAVRYGVKITVLRFSAVSPHDAGPSLSARTTGWASLPTRKRKFSCRIGKNTGLGLALSREILSITGITISENGEPGKGARFEISVPEEAYRGADSAPKPVKV